MLLFLPLDTAKLVGFPFFQFLFEAKLTNQPTGWQKECIEKSQ